MALTLDGTLARYVSGTRNAFWGVFVKIVKCASFLALAVSTQAFALDSDLVCSQYVPAPFSQIDTQIDLGDGRVLDGKNIDCRKVGLAADTITGIRRMIGTAVTLPGPIVFRMVDTFDNAFFNPRDISLNVPFQLMMGKYGKHPIHGIPVWAHEYGHAILNANLAPLAGKWLSIINHQAEGDVGMPKEIVDALIKPYHEFFADVVAVLYTGEGNCVARALYMTGFVANPEGSPHDCPNRDESCHPRNGGKADIRNSLSNRDFTDRSNELGRWRGVSARSAHNLLAPSRYHVYKYYLSNPAMANQRAKMIAVTLDAVIADVNRRLKRMKTENGTLTQDSVNRELSDVMGANEGFLDTLDRSFSEAF